MSGNKLNLLGDTKPVCFVIMPFSDMPGYEENHFSHVYNYIYKPAIEQAGLTPLRCDEICNGRPIHENMFKQLFDAPMVLCDVTGDNPNVLYELGRRDAYGKPFVIVREEGQASPFNIREYNIIPYHKELHIYDVPADIERIKKALIETRSEFVRTKETTENSPKETLSLRVSHYGDWDTAKQRAKCPGIQVEPNNISYLSSVAENEMVEFLVSGREIRRTLSFNKNQAGAEYAKVMLEKLKRIYDDYTRLCNPYDSNCQDADDLLKILKEHIDAHEVK